MLRSWSVGGLLLLCVLQVGCGICGPRFGCDGCGQKYWGAYVEDPPRCEPCDCFGNWIGRWGGRGNCCEASCGEASCGVASCGEPSCGVDSCCSSGCSDPCSKFPWSRSRNRRASFWQMLSACNASKNANCCGTGCCEAPTCCEPTCEPTCGEPACGEPGCGYTMPYGSPAHNDMGMSMRSSAPMHMTSASTGMDYRMPVKSGCNCGKH